MESRYACDLAGQRFAVEAWEEGVVQGPDGTLSVSPMHMTSCWDGRLFWACKGAPEDSTDYAVLPISRFKREHDYLGIIFRTPPGGSASIQPEMLVPQPPPGVTRCVELADFEGERVLEVRYEKSEWRWVLRFAMDRGGYLVAEDTYDGDVRTGEMRAVVTDSLGVWLPQTIVQRSFGEDGAVTLVNRWDLDLGESTINGPAPDPRVFSMNPPAGAELSDYRGGRRVNFIVQN